MKNKKSIISYLLSLLLILTSLPIPIMATETHTTATNNILIKGINQESTTSGAIDIDLNTYIGNGYNVKFEITNRWDGAFNANVIITNTGDKSLENWSLGFEFAHEISNIWNAQIVSHQGNGYIIKNVTSNQDIAVGESITIGIQATCTDEINVPTQYNLLIEKQQVAKEDYTINFKVTNDWETGFNGEISITNNTKEPIEDWILEFDFDREIERFWTAEIQEHEKEHYIVKNAGYNANIKAGETLVLGFSGSPGKLDSEPKNYILNQIQIGQEVDYDKDTDGDKLPDYYEKILGTDINKEDTDGDDLPDGYEYFFLGTNPLLKDTDDNGILDGDEDFDNDKLTNSVEYKLGTNPYSDDTDSDYLADWDEVYTYNTNPLVADTDGDAIDDGDEVKLGLDPLNQYTHGMLDSEYQVEQIISSDVIGFNQKEDKYQLSLDITASGCVENNLYVSESPYYNALKDNSAVVGTAFDVSYDAGKVKKAKLKFKIDESFIENPSEQVINEDTLIGIKRLCVFKYFEGDNLLLPITTDFDEENNTIIAEVSSLGNYCIVDLETLMNNWGISNQVGSEEFEKSTYMNLNTRLLSDTSIELNSNTRFLNNTSADMNSFTSALNSSRVVNSYSSILKKNIPSFINQNAYAVNPDNGSQYALLDAYGGITWKEAKAICEKLGGHLVTITSQKEQDFITKKLLPNGTKYMYWIGGSYLTGQWQWITDDIFKYQNGPNNKVDATKSPYLQMYRASKDGFIAGEWHAQRNEGTKDGSKYDKVFAGYICEWDKKGKDFDYISSNSLNHYTLKGDLERYGTTNSDTDSLTDAEEVNWTLMRNGKLPTLGELLAAEDGYIEEGRADVDAKLEQLDNDPQRKGEFLSKKILPLKSDPLKEDGDEDGIWDDNPKEPNKLRKDTIETMFKLSSKNKKENPVYIEIHNNEINIIVHVKYSGEWDYYLDNELEITCSDVVSLGITGLWDTSLSKEKINIYGIDTTINVTYYGEPVSSSGLYDKDTTETNRKKFLPIVIHYVNPGKRSNVQIFYKWAITNLGTVNIHFFDEDGKQLSYESIMGVSAHEFGHVMGLGDAYGEEGVRTEAPFSEVPANDLMRTNEVLSSKDVLMMLTAWRDNQSQEFPEMK